MPKEAGTTLRICHAAINGVDIVLANIEEYLKLVPVVKQSPEGYMWVSHDAEGDTLYINFKKPSHATDSELTVGDEIIRHEDNTVIDLTVLHASKR